MEWKLPLLLDGATGSNLMAVGMPQGVCTEQWVCENPQAILSLQKAYADAGAQVLYAPTFGANRAVLARHGLDGETVRLNRMLTALSKEAAAGRALVAGDVSPTGLFIAPFGDASFDTLYDIYTEQICALRDAGADFIMVETVSTLPDMRAAVLAGRDAGLPVAVTITVEPGGRTMAGVSPLGALLTLQSMGIAAFGLNCSTGPDDMVPLIQSLASYSTVPLIAKPNAALPPNVIAPEPFAHSCRALLEAGARVLGGCCGTTPAHIAALRAMLAEWKQEHNGASPAPDEEKLRQAACAVTTERGVFFLGESPVLSAPVACGDNLTDGLMDAEGDAVLVSLRDEADARDLCENAYLSPLPIAVETPDDAALIAALRGLQGRIAVKPASDGQRQAAEQYGAVML